MTKPKQNSASLAPLGYTTGCSRHTHSHEKCAEIVLPQGSIDKQLVQDFETYVDVIAGKKTRTTKCAGCRCGTSNINKTSKKDHPRTFPQRGLIATLGIAFLTIDM